MSFIFSFLFLLLIPSIDSLQPTLKLTFTPDEAYYTHDHQVEILCEILNPTERTESPQLWHIDLRTSKHTAISRSLINNPAEDAPEVFKQNKQKRIEYVRKNHIRIRRLALEDTARYECNCPDCEEPLGKRTADLHVMKLAEPKWHIEPSRVLQENGRTTIRCTVDDFYPYVTHKILRNHHDVTNEGKSNLPTSNVYPQRFSWEATVSPTADWHNTTLRCTVTEGNTEQHASTRLEVLFTPRFTDCKEHQVASSDKEKAIIECGYAGNPAPKLLWVRQSDGKQLNTDVGITIETKDEHHGKYRSIITLDRDKLIAIPTTTTTKAPNAGVETSTASKYLGENYFQQLLNGGFTVKLLTSHNEQHASRNIQIVSDAQQAKVNTPASPSSCSRSTPLTSILFGFISMLFFLLAYP